MRLAFVVLMVMVVQLCKLFVALAAYNALVLASSVLDCFQMSAQQAPSSITRIATFAFE
jgi:hypothetical protein